MQRRYVSTATALFIVFLELMNVPIFSLAYTTVRPQCVQSVIAAWEERAGNREAIEWVISTDAGDSKTLAAVEAAMRANPRVKSAINHGSRDCNAGWNAACAATTGKVIIAVSDDFMPPERWDEKLLSLEPKGWEDGEWAVFVDDGYVHTIMVLPIITRKRYERFGYLYYPKYRSMFNDTELTEVAQRDGVVIEAHHILFEHLHPDCGKRPRDQVDLVHSSRERWNASEMLFNFRKARGFPLDDGPKAAREETVAAPKQSDLKFAVYMQVTQDDLCLLEVCRRLLSEGLRDFFLAVPNEYWSGEPVPQEKSDSLKPVIEALLAEGANVQVKHFSVADYRVANDSRIVVETRVRNDSLAWIRKQGFQHILIVDGDELWMPGTLDLIKPFINQGHSAISVKMIPVIGNPGYPVDDAQDVAVVYIGPKCNFRTCRTPTAQQTIIEQPRIIHFTSVRRTMEENIAKHRRSGHYDDPDYDFEGWLKDKLPNARPGMADAHMYKRYQIWKKVRAWRPEELAIIPSTIHQYLGQESCP